MADTVGTVDTVDTVQDGVRVPVIHHGVDIMAGVIFPIGTVQNTMAYISAPRKDRCTRIDAPPWIFLEA